MRTRITALALGGCMALAHGTSAAQPGSTAPPVAGQPPVLSTTPTLPPGARTEPAQMSGMPLQVGDLPPGTVAVRVIRKTFGQNVVNVPVELWVGTASAAQSSVTDPDGRAIFQGLRLGDVVRTKTTVDGEALESQSFQLPAQGGVRLVLVAGVGAHVPSQQVQTFEAAPGGTDAPPFAAVGAALNTGGMTAAADAADSAPSTGATSGESAPPMAPAAIAAGLLLTALTGGFWWRRGGRRQSAVTPPRAKALDSAQGAAVTIGAGPRVPYADDAREQIFGELVALERAMKADHSASGDDRAARQALIDAIVRLDRAGQR